MLPPGPIANHLLLKKNGQPRARLRVTRDYRGVNEAVWNLLISMYGGGPAIKRQQINIYEDEEDTQG